MPPTLASPQTGVAGAIQAEKARMAGGLGFGDTIKNTNGPAGLVVPAKNKAVKSLLS
jgi:hypothetical protein